jgi:hypothetical protein
MRKNRHGSKKGFASMDAEKRRENRPQGRAKRSEREAEFFAKS